ncbi:hypothetical protein LJB90_03210 [Eubacteriales bacterium OttesenSCG-928-G02]|nr:hypothetical protein [Eubacteriales bacterium OttesenSCG-928-G02]
MSFLESHKFRVFIVIFVSLLLAIFCTVMLLNNIEIDKENSVNGYYIQVSTEVTVFVIITLLVTVLFIVLAINKSNKTSTIANIDTSTVVFTSALLGFMLATTGIYSIYIYLGNIPKIILSVLMVFASLPYLYSSLFKNKTKMHLLPYMNIATIFFIMYRLILDFIDQNSMPVNISGAIHIISLIFLLLFLIQDGKTYMSNKVTNLFVAFGYLAAFMLLLHGLPHLLLSAFWILTLDSSVLVSAVDIIFAIHIFNTLYNINENKNLSTET